MHCVSGGGGYLVNAYCDVQEEDQWRRESYEASWLHLVMETRPQNKQTLSEKDVSHKETYEQQQVVHFLVQRSPDQRLRLGRQGGVMTEHQLPSRTLFPVPLFKPSRAASPWDSQRASSPSSSSEAQGSIMQDQENNGVCMDKQEVSAITKDLPKPTQPIRVNFRASSLMSSPRETSHRAQRRE